MKSNFSKYIKIYNLLEKDPEIRVKINEKLRLLIRSKVKLKFKSISKFAKFLGLRKSQIIFWITDSKRRTKAKFSMLIKICNHLNISKEMVYNNIEGFSTQGSYDTVYNLPKSVKVDDLLLQGIGLYVGDGYNKKGMRRIVFINNNEELIKFYINWLKTYMNVSSNQLSLYIYSNDLKEKQVKNIFKLNLKRIKIYKAPPNNESNYKLMLSTAIYRRFLDLLIELSKNICRKNSNYAINYLKGIFAAEGCVHIPNVAVPQVFIEMKKGNDISHIEELFKLIDVRYSKYNPRDINTKLCLYREDQIRRFDEFELASLNEDKQNKLNRVIEIYNNRL